MDILKRGEIYLVDLDINKGSEVNSTRPCVVIQNDIGNKYSRTTNGVVLLEQIRTIDKTRIVSKCISKLTTEAMGLVRTAALVSLAL